LNNFSYRATGGTYVGRLLVVIIGGVTRRDRRTDTPLPSVVASIIRKAIVQPDKAHTYRTQAELRRASQFWVRIQYESQ